MIYDCIICPLRSLRVAPSAPKGAHVKNPLPMRPMGAIYSGRSAGYFIPAHPAAGKALRAGEVGAHAALPYPCALPPASRLPQRGALF